MLINLNDAEVKFALHAVREAAAKLESKLSTGALGQQNISPVGNAITVQGAVRLTKAGKPAKKPGRKPKAKKPVVTVVTEAA